MLSYSIFNNIILIIFISTYTITISTIFILN
nr:MAG TPA: hypothetical protein [Caudoviricetes sp.]